jgi:hypothetical protein
MARRLIERGDFKGVEPLKDDGFSSIWLKPDGTAWLIEDDLYPVKIAAGFAACGAPTTFMLGALYAGATAEEAVRLAIQHTDGAAGEVQVERIG